MSTLHPAERIVFQQTQALGHLGREFAIFGMLVEGRTVTAIARELALSVKTVSTHKMRVMRKMNLRNQSELVRYAIQNGVVPSEAPAQP